MPRVPQDRARRAGATERPERALLPGGPLDYVLRRSPRARRLRVAVDPRRGVVVTLPVRWRGGSGGDAVAAFLIEREAWIRRHLARRGDALARAAAHADVGVPYRGVLHRLVVEPAGRTAVLATRDVAGAVLLVRRGPTERRATGRIVEAWLRERARELIAAAIALHAPALGVTVAAVSVRDQRTRWGSASRTGRLSFSWRLVLAPPPALETVVVHELAHLREFGHGPGFWALVATRRPDHRAWRRWLRDHATELHAVLAADRLAA